MGEAPNPISTTMFQLILSFLSGPLLGKVVDAYKLKLEAGNNSERIAADLAEKAILLDQKASELEAQYKISTVGAWYSPDHLLGYIAVIYIGKVVIWDKVLSLGNTDPIHGDVGVWFGWIVGFWLMKRGSENVARILRRG